MKENTLINSLLIWREPLTAIVLAALGLYWIINSHGILYTIGFGFLITGTTLAYAGYQRIRFKRAETGGGLIDFTEGQISYFGPKTGAIFSIDEINCLILDQSNSYSKWIVEITAGNKVEIPTNVKGNEVLFDIFNNLEGFRTEKMLEALSSSESIKTVLWQK
tara:strand:+ start:610 stop:1098 length:489 start_codon:yes stop_codon:yes gene_type:complete